MVTVLNRTASIANHFLYELRHQDIQKDRPKFRRNLEKIGQVMGYELSKVLPFQSTTVQTPLGHANIELLPKHPVLVTILRASMPFFNGVLDYFDQSDVAFVGAYRKEEAGTSVELSYMATPSVQNETVIIIDPMLATGKSMVRCYEELLKFGLPSNVHFVSVVAAPEGIDYIQTNLSSDCHIWIAALDEGLNEMAYITPGLGDAGDLSFGEKI